MHRRHSGPVNRVLLSICGLVLVAAGAVGLVIGTGIVGGLVRSETPRGRVPGRHQLIVGQRADAVVASPTVGVVALLVAAVIVLAGLAWLLFQLPERDPVPVLRLHHDPRAGTVTCDSNVVATAMADRVGQMPDVRDASIRIHGTVGHPEVWLDLEVDARSMIADVTRAAVERLGSDYRSAFGADVDRLVVRIAVGSRPVSSRAAVLTPARPSVGRSMPRRAG